MTLTIEAPSDAQLRFIRRLCEDYGWTEPDAVCSKAEAGEIIDAMKAGTYDYRRYEYPWGGRDA